jgi:Uma2 family endonuclease
MLWNEPKGPDFVLEVTSASTRRDDERRKREVYAALGVTASTKDWRS